MIRYTPHFLKKIETLFEEGGFAVRYEKGNFQSGYCVVQSRKIVVVNKFFDTEGRLNSLLEILNNIALYEDGLSDSSMKLYQELMKAQPLPEEAESTPTKETIL